MQLQEEVKEEHAEKRVGSAMQQVENGVRMPWLAPAYIGSLPSGSGGGLQQGACLTLPKWEVEGH